MMRAVLLALSLCLVSTVEAAQVTAFVNVNVVPMNREMVMTGRTVIVDGERIVAIGDVATTVLPDDAVVVDGTDRYLAPGLAEMHGHVTGSSDRELERLFALYLANGITTVRGMLGQPAHLELRAELASGRRLGPRLITSGPSFNGNSVTGPTQAAERVRAQVAAGYDFLKIHPGLTRAEFMAVATTANELGIPFAGHVPADVGVAAALEAGISTIDHLDGYMEALIPADEDPSGGYGGFFGLQLASVARESRIDDIVRRTVAAGTWNVPTESLFEHTANDVPAADLADWPEMKYVARDRLDGWVEAKNALLADPLFRRETADRAIELRRLLIRKLHEAGAGLLLGSDSPQRFNVPGFSLHRELGYLVASGLTPFEALRTGTVSPAAFFGETAERGTVEVGRIADLVLLDENPLDDIANSGRVHGTMLRGRWISRPELDRMLAAAEIS
jgi:imidazolonepropionase-like amidohydrolase